MWRSTRGWFIGALLCASTVAAPCAAQEDWGLTRRRAPVRSSGGRAAPHASRRTVEQGLRALQRKPNDGSTWAQVEHQLVEREGGLDAAVRWLEGRVDAGSERAVEHALLSRLLESQRRLEEAEREVADARRSLHAAELDLRHAALLRELGRPAEAREVLSGVAMPGASREQYAEALRALAELDLEAGDVEAARARYATLNRLAGSGTFAAAGFARALSAAGLHALAADEYVRLARARRGDPRASAPLWRDAARQRLLADDAAAASDAAREGLRAAGRRSTGLRRELFQLRVEAARLAGTLASLAPELEREAGADVELTLMAAGVWRDLGEPARAEALYRKAIRLAPREGEARLALAQLLSSTGQLEAAVEQYEALVASAPDQPELLVELAELLVRLGRADRAREVVARASVSYPRAVALHRALAELYARWDLGERAAAELQLLTRLEPDEPAHWIALGALRLEAGDKRGARKAWQQLLKIGGDEADREATLARVLADHDQLAEAIAHMERARALRQNDMQLERDYASLLERASRLRDAEAAWQGVLHSDSADAAARKEARQHLVALWKRTGRLSRRIVALEGRFGGPDADLESGRTLAEALARTGPSGLSQAADVLEQLVAADPQDIESQRALARVYVELGRSGRALDVLEQLSERDVAGAQEHLRHAVEIALESYQDARALALAQRAVRTFPGSADSHALLGELYLRQQQLDQAARSFEECLRVEPQRFEVAMTLAAVEVRRGHFDAARELYLRVLRAARDDALARRAGSALFQLHVASRSLDALEREVLPLASSRAGRPLYRRLLVDTYSAWLGAAARRVRAGAARAGDRTLLREVATRALRPLLEALSDPDPSQREAALALLGPMGHPGAVPALLALARDGEGGRVRAEALIALALLEQPEAVGGLLELATGPGVRLRPLATWALARVGGPAAARGLQGLLRSRDRGVRVMAALGLGHLQARWAAPALAELEGATRHDGERAAIVLALAALGEPPSPDALVNDLAGTPRLLQGAILALASDPEVLAGAVLALPEPQRALALQVLVAPPGRLLVELPVPAWPVRTEDYMERLTTPAAAAVGADDLERAAGLLLRPLREALAAGGAAASAALEVLGGAAVGRGLGAFVPRAGSQCVQMRADLDGLAARLAPVLVETSERGEPRNRRASLRLLARAGGEGAEARLISVLASDDVEAREGVLEALRSRRPEAGLRRAVREAAGGAAGWNERRLAVDALGEPRSEAEVTALERLWLAEDAAVVRMAIVGQWALSPLPGARRALEAASHDPEPAVARHARALQEQLPGRPKQGAVELTGGCLPAN